MTSRHKSLSTVVMVLAVAVLLLCGCGHSTRLRYQDGLVKVTERSTINFLNVHASSDTEVLTIWGRDFNDVRGLDPCYLMVTNKHLILFITGKTYDNGQATIHLADLTSKKIQDIPAYDSNIGSEIGATEKDRYERVASIDGDKLVIEAAFVERRYKYIIDLAKPKFEREEVDIESALPPHKMVHRVYEGGRHSGY